MERGDTHARWIAPYTLATQYRVAGKAITMVRWFDENGNVTRQLSGCGIDAPVSVKHAVASIVILPKFRVDLDRGLFNDLSDLLGRQIRRGR